MKNKLVTLGVLLMAAAVQAQVTTSELTAVETAVSDVETIWGGIATLIIGVAAVMVGKRFLRRAGS